VGAKCWESKSEGLDPKHQSERHKSLERARERKERGHEGRNAKVVEHMNSVTNACSPLGVIPRGSYL
jgi:hypothetical protein